MPGWPVALVGVLAIALVIVAVAVLYARFAPLFFARSLVISLACGAVGAVAWFGFLPLVGVALPPSLVAPVGALGALAAIIASLAPRSLGASPLGALIFAAVWSVCVFVPVARATFGSGVIGVLPVDHGGSLAVNVAAGASALGVLVIPRARPVIPPSRVPRGWGLAAVIALVVGWVGWLVAAELVIDELSVDIVVNSIVAAGAGAGGWLAVQQIRHQSISLGAVVAGLVSGLVAVTAGAPLMSPIAAATFGAGAGALACLLTLRRIEATGRQQWFIVGSHLLAGALGLVLLGLLATGTGFAFTGQIAFIQDQLLSTAAVAGYSAVISLLLWLVLSRMPRS